jgi:hypothetical protein
MVGSNTGGEGGLHELHPAGIIHKIDGHQEVIAG